MVLVTLATWTVRGFRVIPQISGAGWGTVKGNSQRFWLQIATEITKKSFPDKKLRQKTVWNSGLEDTEDEPAPVPEILGYTIENELGSGRMGVVYAARQHDPDRPVALKLLKRLPGSDGDEDAQIFRHEANTIAGLDHSNIVTIYETV